MRILVVDDERGFTELICERLVSEHFEADAAHNGVDALDKLKGKKYDLVVLDVMMPKMDGIQVLEAMRKAKDKTPVIFLTAKTEESDKVKGLRLGADDYVTKPFGMAELMERIKAVLRRSSPGSEMKTLAVGKAKVDFEKLTVTYAGKVEEISPFEANLLRLLASDLGKVFTRDEILDKVWGQDAFPTNRTVDNYIVKLRQKIEPDAEKPKYIITVYGAGYKLNDSRK